MRENCLFTLTKREKKRVRQIAGLLMRLRVAIITVAVMAVVTPAQSQGWTATGQLAVPRAGQTVTRLADGRFLVAGGENDTGLVGQAEIFDLATGTTVATATPMVHPRRGHTATLLADGRVLFAGGGGRVGILSQAEIFDPATLGFVEAGAMVQGRTKHTATVLTPNWVLIAGGNGGAGAVNSMEIYNVPRNQFQLLTATLAAAREHHTATLQPDGTVFFAGGIAGASALASTEILNPEDWSVAAGPPLQQGRYDHSATLTIFGDLVFAGGTDGTSPLASVETLFHGEEGGVLDFVPDGLSVARSGHQASALPQSGNIMLVGGVSENGAVAEAQIVGLDGHEAFVAGAMSEGRTEMGVAVGAGRACALGGRGAAEEFLASVECYAYASLATDQADYAPNSVVTFSGGAWQPGESVEIVVQALGRDTATTVYAVADGRGSIVNRDFATTDADLGALFYVAATGAGSGRMAFLMFTDQHATIDPCGVLVSLCSVTPDLLDPFTEIAMELDIRGVGTFNTFDVIVTNWDDPSRTKTFKDVAKSGNILSLHFPTPTVASQVGGHMDIFFKARLVVSVPTSVHCHKKVFGVCVAPHVHTTKVTTLSANSNSRELRVNPPAPGTGGGTGDTTAPSINPDIMGMLGDNDWYVSDVTVSWTVEDPESNFSTAGCETSTVTSDTAGVTFTCSATSGGGTATESVTIKREATPPVITFGTPTQAPNPAGWNNSDVSLPFTTSDNLSGLADPVPASPLVIDVEGMAVSGEISVTDLAGNEATASSPAFNIDTTAPSITGSRTPGANVNDWNNTDVTISFVCSDSLSGLAAGSPPTDTVLSAEGAGQSVTAECFDVAGNSASDKVADVNIDKTAPQISGATDRTPDSNNWYNHAVEVRWTCTDALSGVGACSPLSTYNGPDSTTATVMGTDTDLAGNSASVDVSFQYDATAPVISLVTPADNDVYLLDQTVVANYSCSDNLSGVSTCSGPVADGGNVATSAVGSQNFTVNAKDAAGNATQTTHSYDVHYVFEGFFQPVGNLPVSNSAKAGRAIPLKWTLKNAQGEIVSDLGSFASLLSFPTACDASPVAIVEEEAAATGGTVLRFESGQFIYNWQTSNAWSGCRVLQLSLADGTQHLLKFEFR